MLILLIILLIVFFAFPFTPMNSYGNAAWSPLGVILLILVILLLTGNLGGLHLR